MEPQQVVKLRTYEDTDKFRKKMAFPRTAMIKYDGRCTTIVKHDSGEVDYLTTGGKLFKLENDQVFGWDSTPPGVYFAEMMGGKVVGKLGDRIHSGIQTTMFTNTSKGITNKHEPTWRIFDFVSIEDYVGGKSSVPFGLRWAFLEAFISNDYLADSIKCYNASDWDHYHTAIVAGGWEGTVSIDDSQLWVSSKSRPHTQVKRKDRKDADLICYGAKEGTGKYEGMIGSLLLKDSAGLKVDVGSGLTDAQRAMDPDYYIGKVVEIVYEQKIDTYIQPIFNCVREDKDIKDIS